MTGAPLDWSLVRAFLAVADHGSLSAAARSTGATQPTLGRQIKALEAQLGATLFHRQARGFDLSAEGVALLEPARQMAEGAQRIALIAAGRSGELRGTVRITASVMVSAYHLPEIAARIRAEEPGISLEIVASDASSNLLFREADIAVRMFRPTQSDLVARRLGDLSLGMFASRDYVARRGQPAALSDLAGHDLVGYDSDTAIIDGLAAAGLVLRREDFSVRTDDGVAYWRMVRAGCGIGFGQSVIGRDDPEMVAIDLGLPVPSLPVWLTAHEALRRTPRIRRVWDLVADGLSPLLDPPGA